MEGEAPAIPMNPGRHGSLSACYVSKLYAELQRRLPGSCYYYINISPNSLKKQTGITDEIILTKYGDYPRDDR